MITLHTRLCSSCRAFLPDPPAPQVCAKCDHVAVPMHGEWPAGLKEWLAAQLLTHFFAPYAAAPEQYRWERLLSAVIAGRQWGAQVVPYAYPSLDCFMLALQLQAASAPSLASDTSRSAHAA